MIGPYLIFHFLYKFSLALVSPLVPLSLVAAGLIPSWQGAAVKQEGGQEGAEGATAANGRF